MNPPINGPGWPRSWTFESVESVKADGRGGWKVTYNIRVPQAVGEKLIAMGEIDGVSYSRPKLSRRLRRTVDKLFQDSNFVAAMKWLAKH